MPALLRSTDYSHPSECSIHIAGIRTRSNDVKTTQRGRVLLELRDVIRLNLLVRDRIDFDGFKRWYHTLYIPEQAALTCVLCEFACQAGFDDATCRQAIIDAMLDPTDPTVIQAQSFCRVYKMDVAGLYGWMLQLEDIKRVTVFRYYIYLFGHAEGKTYPACRDSGQCNHWWHGDLPTQHELDAAPRGHPIRRIHWPGTP